MSEPKRIGFIGLGVMGGPMAGHLAAAGHSMTVYNRTRATAERWCAEHDDARLAEDPAAAAEGVDVLVVCVGRDEDLRDVLLDGAAPALPALSGGTLLIDHTTVSAGMARHLAERAGARGIEAIDAPVSGGQAGAKKGALAIMCGGEAAAVERARSVMEAYGARIVHVGPAGAGQTAKMANQMCIAGVLGGLAEAVRLTQAAGLDVERTLEAIGGGAAQSWQMENRWHSMHQSRFDFGFAIDWMRKDLGYALDEADRLGLAAPVTALVDQFYAELQAGGHGRNDTSALVARLPEGKAE